jgi:sigma-E factor negative regulatory protein RseB
MSLVRSSAVGLTFVSLFSVAHAQDVREWLDRMNRAVEELNYEGTFVHVLGAKTETLHVVHRNEHGQIGERLVSLDGVGREIVRQQDRVQCILPDQKVVLEETKDASPLISALPNYSEQLEENYRLKLLSTARVAGRRAQAVGITPIDDYRYGYVLLLDEETAMPLKSKVWDKNGEIVEQILFTRIEFPESIPAAALDATISTDGFTLLQAPKGHESLARGIPWKVTDLPQGFRLSVSTHRPIAGSQYPVEHLVYSDGLATVSVFIEDPKAEADVSEGFSRVGSTNAFSVTFEGRTVTAVGEVPRRTVEQIATSVRTE